MTDDLLREILGELKELKSGQQKMDADINTLKAGQQQLHDDVAGLKIGQQELKYDVTALKTDVTGIKADITGIKSGQQKLEADIATIHKDTARIPYIEQAVSEVGFELLENGEITDLIQKTVTEYKVTLDLLSARSIDHEGKLKQIM